MSIQYALASLLWGAGGFIAGIAVCHRKHRGEHSVSDGNDDTRPRWRRHLNSQTIIGLLMLAVVAGSVFMVASQAAANRHQADTLARISACQREYNEAFKAGLRTRSEASDRDRKAATQERAALRGLVTTILASPDDSNASRAALGDFLRASEAADQERIRSEQSRREAPLPTKDCDPDNIKSRPGG
jgi:hypothetical protein